MSAASISPRHATTGRRMADESTMLESSLAGHRWADEQLCDLHAGALLCLALAVLPDRERAESVVVGVVADACTQPGLIAADDEGSLRHDLARLTYERCVRAMVQSAATRQRALLGLCGWGAHTYRQAGALMGLPAPEVAALLRAGLLEVPQPRPG